MFRRIIVPSVISVRLPGDDVITPFANASFVRWRKRRWIPVTPSKLFVVRERTPQDLQEYEELKKLHANYRTTLRSIV